MTLVQNQLRTAKIQFSLLDPNYTSSWRNKWFQGVIVPISILLLIYKGENWDTSKLNHAWQSKVKCCRRLWDMKFPDEEKGNVLASAECLLTCSTPSHKDIVLVCVLVCLRERRNSKTEQALNKHIFPKK